jgi:hypothetical protein
MAGLVLIAGSGCQTPKSTPAPAADTESGLVASYTFEQGAAVDKSPTANNGVTHGTVPVADRFGSPNSALRFPGDSSHVEIPHTASLDIDTTGFTISFWATVDSSVGLNKSTSVIISKCGFPAPDVRKGFTIAFHGDLQTVDFETWYGAPTAGCVYLSLNPPRNAWIHVAMTKSGKTSRAYYNGELHNVQMVPMMAGLGNNGPLYLGGMGASSSFRGALDDVRIYNRCLTDADVKALYDRQRAR